MNSFNILAHRGFWSERGHANSHAALEKAIEMGFGIETDVRDLDGRLVVSHDPPCREDHLAFEDILSMLKNYTSQPRIALNIKSDGLQCRVKELLGEWFVKPTNFFVFDMSVPDTLGYQREGVPFYCRVSEYEPESIFLNDSVGVWVDNFSGEFDQVAMSKSLLERGKRVAFVSPELHGRAHEDIWGRVRGKNLHNYSTFELCTDFPIEAQRFFGGSV